MTFREEFLNGSVVLLKGDCIELLASLPDGSIDSIVCDPPYGIRFMGKAWDGADIEKMIKTKKRKGTLRADGYARHDGAAFAAGTYDTTLTGNKAFQVWTLAWACEAFRVLKSGGHIICFASTRTYHRMASGIEDAGFEIRDQIGWVFGSGFPKSHNLNGVYQGWGTALKPAWEPICLARKPLIGTVAQNVLEHGTGAINIDGCRVETAENLNGGAYTGSQRHDGTENWRFKNGGGRQPMPGDEREGAALGMFQPGKTAGKGYVQPTGRWPANIIHDGSEEVLAAFPDAPGQQQSVGPEYGPKTSVNVYGDYGLRDTFSPRFDSGSAARFFYTAKADAEDRLGSKHPTVKPLDLMQYLVRLVTPKGGTTLDPFAGTGTTGEAAWREGMKAVLIEREPEYQADIARRMDLATKPSKRAAVAKTKNQLDDPNKLPLFAEKP